MEWGNGAGLTRILQRLQGRTNASRKYRENYHRYLADSRASAGFHARVRDVIYPIVGERAAGARIWDADGNQYIDLAMGFGVQLFGHAAPFIKEALLRQIEAGLHVTEAVNVEIAADRAIRATTLPRAEAFGIPDIIRTATNLLPDDIAEVRIVDIAGLDVQADGGTHVASTAMIGRVEVVKLENKGRGFRRLRVRVI